MFRKAIQYSIPVFMLFSANAYGLPIDQTYFTDFSQQAGGGADPADFTFGPANFTGGEVFFAGVPGLYITPPNAWVVGPGGTLDIAFLKPMKRVELFAIGLDGAELRVLGTVDQDNIVDVAGSDIRNTSVLAFTGRITGLQLVNTSVLPNVGKFDVYGASIDNLGFSPVPEPGTLSLSMIGLTALAGGAYKRRRRKSEATAETA